jgi:hypothetical protein
MCVYEFDACTEGTAPASPRLGGLSEIERACTHPDAAARLIDLLLLPETNTGELCVRVCSCAVHAQV